MPKKAEKELEAEMQEFDVLAEEQERMEAEEVQALAEQEAANRAAAEGAEAPDPEADTQPEDVAAEREAQEQVEVFRVTKPGVTLARKVWSEGDYITEDDLKGNAFHSERLIQRARDGQIDGVELVTAPKSEVMAASDTLEVHPQSEVPGEPVPIEVARAAKIKMEQETSGNVAPPRAAKRI